MVTSILLNLMDNNWKKVYEVPDFSENMASIKKYTNRMLSEFIFKYVYEFSAKTIHECFFFHKIGRSP